MVFLIRKTHDTIVKLCFRTTFCKKNLVDQIQVFKMIRNQQILPWPNQSVKQINAKRIWIRILDRILDPQNIEIYDRSLDPIFTKDLDRISDHKKMDLENL